MLTRKLCIYLTQTGLFIDICLGIKFAWPIDPVWLSPIMLTPYMVLQLFATTFADYAGDIQVFFIQPCLF